MVRGSGEEVEGVVVVVWEAVGSGNPGSWSGVFGRV